MTLFGGNTQAPTFGQQNSMFMSPAPSGGGILGGAQTVGGQTPTAGSFGFSSPSPFGSSTPSAGFGSPAFGSSSLTFGGQPQNAKPATPTTGFGAGTQPSTGFGVTPQATTSFGAPTPQTGFGSTPTTGFGAATQATTGFGTAPQQISGFGAVTTGFGTPAQSTSGFGVPTATTGFGVTSQPSLGLGTTAQPATSFGTPQFGASQPLGFGSQPSATALGGTGFGAQPATTTTQSTALTFQSASTTPTTALPSFETTSNTTQPFTSFGLKPTTTATITQSSLTLTPSTTSSMGGLLGASGSTLFGTPAAATTAGVTAVTTTSGIATGTQAKSVTFGPTTTTVASGFNFDLSSSNFATSTTSTASTTSSSGFGSLLTGLTSKPSTTVSSATALTSATTSSVLGGVPATTTTTTAGKSHSLGGGGATPTAEKAIKDEAVPAELLSLVQSFRAFTKEQTTYASEVARSSLKPIKKVAEDIENMKKVISNMQSTIDRNRNFMYIMKSDSMRGFSECEIAQGNTEESSAFQVDNAGVLEYFSNLTDRFQEQVISLRLEIESTEKHILSILNPTAITPQELSSSMLKIHESFVAIAGRLQTAHTAMSALKQRHLDFRRSQSEGFTNIFEKKDPSSGRSKIDPFTSHKASPTPFTGSTDYNYMVQYLLKQCQRSQTPKSLEVGNPSFTALRAEGFANPGFGNSFNSSLNLQLKPPPGNKRGKR